MPPRRAGGQPLHPIFPPVVTFKGAYHHLDRAGINPLPVQRPIPVWMGGMAEPVLKRVAQISDGWFPQFQLGDEASHTLDRVRAYVEEARRPLSAVGIEGRFTYGIGGPAEWAKRAREWRALGATHLSVCSCWRRSNRCCDNVNDAKVGGPTAGGDHDALEGLPE